MKYQDFMSELRSLVIRRAERTGRLDTLFAEVAASASDGGAMFSSGQAAWVALRTRDLELGRERDEWLNDLEALVAKQLGGRTHLSQEYTSPVGDMTLSDAAPDHSVLDVDLDALDGSLSNAETAHQEARVQSESLDWESVVVDLGPQEDGDTDSPSGFVWPEGLAGASSQLSALDALAADLDERADPWENLQIRDLRQDGVPSPLQPKSGVELDRAPVRPAQRADERPINRQPINPAVEHSESEADGSVDALFDQWLSTPQEEQRATPPEPPKVRSEQESYVPLSVKLAMRVGDSIYTGFSERIGMERLILTTERQMSVGEVVHLFLELPSGAQLGVNTVIDSLESTADTGGSCRARARYLDLSDDARTSIQALGSPGAVNAL